MKKLFATLALASAVIPVFAAWDGTESEWTKGTGTEADPFLIENESQLAWFRRSVTEGETYEGKYVKLVADLDMGADKGLKFFPIGFHNRYILDNQSYDESKPFLGTFDGGFKTISNVLVVLENDDPDEIGGVGLFALAEEKTTIKNVIFGVNSTVDGSNSIDAGGIVGLNYGGKILNSANYATVKGGSLETAGIAGYCSGTIEGCVNRGMLEAHSSSGGIAGVTEGAVIRNCRSLGAISAEGAYMVGGIVGWANLNSAVTNCYSVAPMTGMAGSSWMPGISPVISELERSTVENCYYVETLTGCAPLKAQEGVIALTEEELKSQATVDALGSAWTLGTDGLPVLVWEMTPTTGISDVSASADGDVVVRAVVGGIEVNAESQAQLDVYDFSGRKVFSTTVGQGKTFVGISLSGTYVVRATSGTGVSVLKLAL